jgi:hypothetical protein
MLNNDVSTGSRGNYSRIFSTQCVHKRVCFARETKSEDCMKNRNDIVRELTSELEFSTEQVEAVLNALEQRLLQIYDEDISKISDKECLQE